MAFNQNDILELEKINEAREQITEKNLTILKAFFNGQNLIIETVNAFSQPYEPTLIVDPIDFSNATGLTFEEHHNCDEMQKKWVFNYLIKGKFSIEKKASGINMLKGIFQDWRLIFSGKPK